MDSYGLHDTWLGTAITLHVAWGFACLSALALACRTLGPRMAQTRLQRSS